MKFIFRLAIKNLSRYRRRTAITAGAIAIGIMAFICVDSIFLGAKLESERNLRWFETASLRIYAPEYWNERQFLPLEYSIQHPALVLQILNDIGLKATTRTLFSADMLLYTQDFDEEGTLPVTVTAINPQTDSSVYKFKNTLQEGRFLRPGEMDGIVLGSWLAADIEAEVGYWVTLLTRGNGGFYEAFDMQIVGIVNCPNPNVNRTLVMMDIQAADTFLAMEGAVTNIDIALDDAADIETVALSLQSALDHSGHDLEVYSWKELAKDYLAIMSAERGASNIILFLVFVIAAVGVSNTMLMAMYERMREIGMMRALGMRDRSIYMLLLIEGGGIGFLGSLIGCLLGALTNLYLVETGIDLGFMFRNMDIGYRIQSVMRGSWSISTMAKAFLSGILLSIIVALAPIRRAMKQDITTCLHHQ
ncbi:MAG: ABC transporter permease [Sphaerochaeta sp.]